MSVLGTDRIIEAMKAAEPSKRLVVTPILDEDQIGEASIDVRLAHDFLTVRRGNIASFDPKVRNPRVDRSRTQHRLNRGNQFFLHPAEMVLASTLEYVRLPAGISAYVTSRSKWGRLGLVIATATAIHPGFTGTITLELVNHGNVPLVLYPGMMVAQLIFADAEGAQPYSGPFGMQTSVFAGSGEWQNDMAFWTESKSK